MRSALFRIAFVTVLSATPLFGQWTADGGAIPDEPWRKSAGSFGGMLLLTTDVERLYADWEKPEQPTVAFTNTADRNKIVSGVVFFTGCKAVEGKCRIEVDFSVLRPDGKEYASQPGVVGWPNLPAAPKGVIQLSTASLGIRIEKQDPAGTYLVKATVRDAHAKTSVDLEQPLSVDP